MNLRTRIERLEARGRRGPSALVLLTEDPTPDAPAIEHREGFLIRRIGANADPSRDVMPPEMLFPPGMECEREDYVRGAIKVYVDVNPLDLWSRPDVPERGAGIPR